MHIAFKINNNKLIWNPPLNLNRLAAANSPKVTVLHMLTCKFLWNVNDTRVLFGLYLLVTSHCSQIRDPWHCKPCLHYSAYSNRSLLLHIHSFIHLRYSILPILSYLMTPWPNAIYISSVHLFWHILEYLDDKEIVCGKKILNALIPVGVE